MYRSIVFYRSDRPAVSPEVIFDWPGKIVDLFNRLPADVWFNGSEPERLCADIVAACYAGSDPKIAGLCPSGLWNLPLRWERLDAWERAHGTRMSGEPWRQWLFEAVERRSAEAEGRQWQPVLVDLDPPYHATQAGKVLCRRLREDEYESGQPLWVQVHRPAVVTFSAHGTEYGEFSNFAPYPIKIDRQWWPSAEHYFQAQKFEVRAFREKVRNADFVVAPRLAQDCEQKVRPNWEAIKVEVLRAAVQAKFEQYEELRELLLSTDDAELVGQAGNDNWGNRGDGSDDNLLGRVLMEVRAAKAASSPDAAPKRRGKTVRVGQSPTAALAGEEGSEAGGYRTFVFYRPDMTALSPAVRVRWPGGVVDLFNRLRIPGGDDMPVGWSGGGNMPECWCVDFVVACRAMPEIGTGRVELHNLQLRGEQSYHEFDEGKYLPGTPEFDEACRKDEDAWRKWLSKEMRRVFAHGGDGKQLPVLVDTCFPSCATQGGKLVCQQDSWEKREPDGPLWVAPRTQTRPKRTPARLAATAPAGGPARSAKTTLDAPLTLYESYTAQKALAAFGDPAAAKFFCDRQFAVFPQATLCFATMGDPDTGTKMQSPSLVVWKPGRLDYHPKAEDPWLPSRLTKCVERNGMYLPLHHMFLRAAGDRRFVYAGIAELPMFGEIPEDGRIQHSAHFYLDAKLPRELWVRLGGYSGWLVRFNNTQRRFAAADVAGFERLLAGVPTTSGPWHVALTGYQEWCLTILFNATRAHLSYRPLYWPCKMGDERGVESWDPDCPAPRRREFFGNGVVVPARRTVPRELAVRGAGEHFRTGRLPECVRWREIKERASPGTSPRSDGGEGR